VHPVGSYCTVIPRSNGNKTLKKGVFSHMSHSEANQISFDIESTSAIIFKIFGTVALVF